MVHMYTVAANGTLVALVAVEVLRALVLQQDLASGENHIVLLNGNTHTHIVVTRCVCVCVCACMCVCVCVCALHDGNTQW